MPPHGTAPSPLLPPLAADVCVLGGTVSRAAPNGNICYLGPVLSSTCPDAAPWGCWEYGLSLYYTLPYSPSASPAPPLPSPSPLYATPPRSPAGGAQFWDLSSRVLIDERLRAKGHVASHYHKFGAPYLVDWDGDGWMDIFATNHVKYESCETHWRASSAPMRGLFLSLPMFTRVSSLIVGTWPSIAAAVNGSRPRWVPLSTS